MRTVQFPVIALNAPRSKAFFRIICFIAALLSASLLSARAQAQELTFRRAVELALEHSGLIKLADANAMRAKEGYKEARGAYLPQMTLGSGLAFTYGYPLSIEGAAPSIVDFSEQQAVFNPQQHELVKAARREWDAANYFSQDRKNAVILETAIDYAQLDVVSSMLKVLAQQQQAALRALDIVTQRVAAGVDAEVELTRARLANAKAQLKADELQGDADVLRTRLAQLTGLAANEIQTQTESIPSLPEISQQSDLMTAALNASPQVKQAEEDAAAKQARAASEHKASYPAVDFVTQYGLFSKANNFQKFFARFQRNNATVGFAIRFPFLNFAQKAHAAAADADALAAQAQAQGIKEQVSTDTLELQRSVRRLAAAKEVARLEYELAHSDAESARVRVQSGAANEKEAQNALISQNQAYIELLQATLDLDETEMKLLKETNELQGWALGGH